MNLFLLAAAIVMFDAASDGSGRTSAAIHYSSYSRSGDSLSLTLTSGDPYYGDRWHHWCPPRYYVTRPVYYIYEPYYTYDPYHQCAHHYDPYYDDPYDEGYVVYEDDWYYEDDPYYGWYDAPRYCDPVIVVENNYYIEKRHKPKKRWDEDRYDWRRYDRDWSRDGRSVLLASIEPDYDEPYRRERSVMERGRTDRTTVAMQSSTVAFSSRDGRAGFKAGDARLDSNRFRTETARKAEPKRQTQRVNPVRKTEPKRRSVTRQTQRVSPTRKAEPKRQTQRVNPVRKTEPKRLSVTRQTQRVSPTRKAEPKRQTQRVNPVRKTEPKRQSTTRQTQRVSPTRKAEPSRQTKSHGAGRPGPRNTDHQRGKKGR